MCVPSIHLHRRLAVRMQVGVFDLQGDEAAGLTAEQRSKLAICFENIHILSLEPLARAHQGDSVDTVVELPNSLPIPYSTAFHYQPPLTADQSALPSRQPRQWDPVALMQHKRPVLMSYVGKTRGMDGKPRWQQAMAFVKTAVCASVRALYSVHWVLRAHRYHRKQSLHWASMHAFLCSYRHPCCHVALDLAFVRLHRNA